MVTQKVIARLTKSAEAISHRTVPTEIAENDKGMRLVVTKRGHIL